jgi:hypothetical protein
VNDLQERIAEGLARSVSRRRFLRKSSQAVFVGLSSVAAGGLFANAAGGHTLNGQAHCAVVHDTYCEPPNMGLYCTGCNGHACPTNYYWTNQWGYGSACWCTNVHGTSYSICCDCSQTQYATQQYSTDCGCSSEVRVL